MKAFISGMSALGPSPCRQHPNHGRKFVCDTIRIWHDISQHYFGVFGSNGLWRGNQSGMDIGRPKSCWDCMITFFSFEGPKQWEIVAADASFWNSMLPYAATFFRIQFTQRYLRGFKLYIRSGITFFPVPETGCPTLHTALTVGTVVTAHYCALLLKNATIKR